MANKLFTIKLNNILVSSNTLNYTNFTGTRSDVNTTTSLQLNLSNQGDLISYSDDFTTTKYQTDSSEYNNAGWTIGRIFELDSMNQGGGNITYRYDAITNFYSANVLVRTQQTTSDGGGNTSVLYSLDNSTWVVLNTTKSKAANMTGSIPVAGKTSFWMRLKSDTTGAIENPIIFYQLNYSSYNYSSSGNFTSGAINIANITYTILRWTETLNDGAISMQLRESDEGSNWGAWNTYSNSMESDISSFTKPYLQYRALLSSTNLSKTPVLYGIQVLYFNASTNLSGGYNYNITIPTTSLGNLPLEVAVSPAESNLVGSNTTYINIWARTSLTYFTIKNYTGAESNYT
ncbi:MAG: hypothetical protein NT076_02500, partial [Candidatus Pacearchaeota archaeon]|nr:hypothetical protein [Candidatus Pacearchaeota archaeon]